MGKTVWPLMVHIPATKTVTSGWFSRRTTEVPGFKVLTFYQDYYNRGVNGLEIKCLGSTVAQFPEGSFSHFIVGHEPVDHTHVAYSQGRVTEIF